LDKYALNIKFHDDRVVVDFPIKGSTGNYKLDLTLFKKINKVKSTHYLRLDGIEIVMEKKSP
jgi:hypothetical protein